MSKRTYKRRLSNYYLLGEIQTSTIVWMIVVCAIVCGILGYLIYQQEISANTSIEEILKFTHPGDSAAAKEQADFIVSDLEDEKRKLIFQMCLLFFVLVSLVGVYVLTLTHKIAGPIYKMGLHLDKMGDGKLEKIWPLRKGDMLNHYFRTFTTVHEEVREKHKVNLELFKNVLEVFPDHTTARVDLERVVRDRESSLGLES